MKEQQYKTLLTELYLVLGSLNAPENVLDQVLAAAEGQELPFETLLPFNLNIEERQEIIKAHQEDIEMMK